MEQLVCKPTLHVFDTCGEFLAQFQLGEEDLILTNAYIFQPFFGELPCGAHVLFQEAYGQGEPSDVMVDAMLADMSGRNAKRIIAIGGGSIIDIAKLLAVATSGATVDSLFEGKDSLRQEKELVILPTTCGTGSEVTNIAIVNRTRLNTKMGIVSDAMFARHAVLIPELLTKLPYPVFATSSLDALVHAVEAFLSPKATPFTSLFAKEAIHLILQGYAKIENEGRESRTPLLKDFLLASTYAGLAFGTAGCATVHAMSYPLGATFHVPHGESNYAVFLGVLRFYGQKKRSGQFSRLMQLIAGNLQCVEADALEVLSRVLESVYPRKKLGEYGMTKQDAATFADTVMRTQSRLLANTFVPVNAEDIRNMYIALL